MSDFISDGLIEDAQQLVVDMNSQFFKNAVKNAIKLNDLELLQTLVQMMRETLADKPQYRSDDE